MQQICPYCGTALDQSSQEVRPGVWLCRTCGQEVDTGSQPEASPQGSETSQDPQDVAQAPPPPPPPPGAAYDAGGQNQAGAQASGQAPAGPSEHTPAWELDGGSWLQKLWRTIWQVLLHPMYTFWAPGRMRQQYPLGFGLIMGTAGSVINVVWDALINPGGTTVAAPIIVVFVAPLGILLGLYLGSGIVHLFLMMVGAARGGFISTFRVTGYSYAGYLFMAIPVLGSVVTAVWMLVVQVAGLAATHGVSRLRVVGAMLLFLGVILAIVVAGAMLVGCGSFLAQMGLEGGKVY